MCFDDPPVKDGLEGLSPEEKKMIKKMREEKQIATMKKKLAEKKESDERKATLAALKHKTQANNITTGWVNI